MGWVIGFVLLYFGWRGTLAWHLALLDRRAATRGWPMDFAAIDAFYALPPGQKNAADALLAAGELMEAIESAPSPEEMAKKEAKQREEDEEDRCFARLKELEEQRAVGGITEAEHEQGHAEWSENLGAVWKLRKARREAELAQLDREMEHDKKIFKALERNDQAALDELLGERTPDYLKDDLPEGAPPLPDEWRAGIAGIIEAHQEAMPHLEAAAAIGVARYPVDFTHWAEEGGASMDALWTLKKGANLLQRAAILHADNEDTGQAVTTLDFAFSLARTLEREPTAMSQLVWLAMTGKALECLEYLLRCGSLTADHLDTLDACLQKAAAHAPFQTIWSGERCLVRYCFDVRDARPENNALLEGLDREFDELEKELESEAGTVAEKMPRRKKRPTGDWRLIYEIPYKLLGLESLDCLLFMRAIERHLDISVGSTEEKVLWLRKHAQSAIRGNRFKLLNSRTCMVQPKGLLLTTLLAETRLTTALCILALERYRLNQGEWPPTLEALPGGAPVDLFSGEPMRYRKLDHGFVVYSVGLNGQDGGGAPGPWRSGADIAFRIMRQ